MLTAGMIINSVSFSIAKYMQRKEVEQQTGYQGPITIYSIFLDIQGSTWVNDSAVFYMYCYDSAHTDVNTWVSSEAHITPTVGGNATNMYVFRFDSTKYTNYNLVRFNPNGETLPGWGWDNNSTWNSTQSIPFNSYTYNYYKINGTTTPNGDGYGHTTSNANWGKITYNYSTSAWSLVYPS